MLGSRKTHDLSFPKKHPGSAIFAYIYHKKSTIHVGKYTSPMDAMGFEMVPIKRLTAVNFRPGRSGPGSGAPTSMVPAKPPCNTTFRAMIMCTSGHGVVEEVYKAKALRNPSKHQIFQVPQNGGTHLYNKLYIKLMYGKTHPQNSLIRFSTSILGT